MDLLQHTSNWYKGEIFEATIVGIFGICLIAVSIVFWKFGKTPNAQAMVIPLVIVGLLLALTGVFMVASNSKTLNSITISNIENQQEFAQTEKQRVEDFQSLYTYTKIGSAIFFAIAIILFFVTDNRHWQAIAIALIITGVSGLAIDYFSKERADVYYHELLKSLK